MCGGKKIKKHRVGLSVGFQFFSLFLFSVLSQWFTFQFIVISVFFLHLLPTVAAMYRAEKETRDHYRISCEPNFVILILNYFHKSQITKFGGGSEMLLPELPA
ncbi:MAG: hypothetical protein JXL97_19225 [Bacteroidales bacterium]|nr:hypothetical protein [Bacteroidales bacterium]